MFPPISKKIIAGVTLCALLLSSCASEISANSYSDVQVGESSITYIGTVIHKREVKVSSDNMEENGLGTTGGALAGMGAGSAVGNGRGQETAMIAGAILGAVAGAIAEKKLKEQTGMEYTLRLEDSSLKSVVQGKDLDIAVGQKVFLMESYRGQGTSYRLGRSRIVPFQQAKGES